jgi:hypothetical protein
MPILPFLLANSKSFFINKLIFTHRFPVDAYRISQQDCQTADVQKAILPILIPRLLFRPM